MLPFNACNTHKESEDADVEFAVGRLKATDQGTGAVARVLRLSSERRRLRVLLRLDLGSQSRSSAKLCPN